MTICIPTPPELLARHETQLEGFAPLAANADSRLLLTFPLRSHVKQVGVVVPPTAFITNQQPQRFGYINRLFSLTKRSIPKSPFGKPSHSGYCTYRLIVLVSTVDVEVILISHQIHPSSFFAPFLGIEFDVTGGPFCLRASSALVQQGPRVGSARFPPEWIFQGCNKSSKRSHLASSRKT